MALISRMRSLFYGVFLIVLIGIGGLVYRNAVERSYEPVACPADARICPDGTSVARTGLSCTFPTCPPPNVTDAALGITYAVPSGFVVAEAADGAAAATYRLETSSSTAPVEIIIRRYGVSASSTPLAVIQETAIGASGQPVSATAFSSTVIGTRRFTSVSIERSEGVIDTAYYLARTTDVLRFDAVDRVFDRTSPVFDLSSLPAHQALAKLLAGLQGA